MREGRGAGILCIADISCAEPEQGWGAVCPVPRLLTGVGHEPGS